MTCSWILAYYTEFIEETLRLIYCSGEENDLSSVSAVCVWVYVCASVC